jgi:ATP-binding cassette subfamily B protein/subfamily B ATP-binding cassette protein MsbA
MPDATSAPDDYHCQYDLARRRAVARPLDRLKTLIAAVKDQVGGQETYDLITRLALLSLAIYLVRAGLQFLRSYMAHIAGWGVVADARRDIYDHLQRLSLPFYEDKQTGNLMSCVVNDSDMFEKLISHAIPDVTVNLLTLIGVSVVLFNLNRQLMLWSLIPVPFVILAMRGFARYVARLFGSGRWCWAS